MYILKYKTPVGEATLASDGTNLTGLWLAGQKYYGATLKNAEETRDVLPIFKATQDWLMRYFAGENPPISQLPLAPMGSDFRQSIWQILCKIPYGEVVTYGDIAKMINCKSAQAVGGAVGHNPISIIIPCHRVIGANGSLTGYAGGVTVKQQLLTLEGYRGDLR